MKLLFLLFLFGAVAAGRDDPLPPEAVSNGEIDIISWNEATPAGMHATALRDGQKKWPNAKVPFKFGHSISTEERNIIVAAMQEIHQKTCVRFYNAQENDQDYVLIVKPLATRACNSFVGRQGRKQQLNLGQDCYHRNIILHELMHALGFIHEHNRADRDEYVSINWDSIVEKHKHNFQRRNARDLTLMDTGYSYDSVMHYPENVFSKDGTPTIVPKRQVAIGGGDHLSSIDTLRIIVCHKK